MNFFLFFSFRIYWIFDNILLNWLMRKQFQKNALFHYLEKAIITANQFYFGFFSSIRRNKFQKRDLQFKRMYVKGKRGNWLIKRLRPVFPWSYLTPEWWFFSQECILFLKINCIKFTVQIQVLHKAFLCKFTSSFFKIITNETYNFFAGYQCFALGSCYKQWAIIKKAERESKHRCK